MKEQIINPFLKASKDIIMQVGNIEIEQKKPYVKKNIDLNDDIGVIIGITGTIKGQVIINFPEEIGKKIASNMMGGMPIATLDNIAKSALCELGNIILGNVATGLYNAGITVDITPPSIIAGLSMNFSVANQQILCIPFTAGDKTLELNISIKED